ncbi:MAG: superoxide dismutase, Ni [Actinobacteria bacterium]|nr:superoxide dismutase, Ni [Actinomycetota bacterium]
MKKFSIKPVYAHCDLPCGVYDPDQARIEAESVHGINQKYDGLGQEDKWRAVMIKEQRLELVKHHLWVIWTDYAKPEHLEAKPDLHDLFWRATKQAGQAKKTTDTSDSQKLLDLIAEVSEWFTSTK